YLPPPSKTLNCRVVATRTSPCLSHSITSPRLTRFHLHSACARTTRLSAIIEAPRSRPHPCRCSPDFRRPCPRRSRSFLCPRQSESTSPEKRRHPCPSSRGVSWNPAAPSNE